MTIEYKDSKRISSDQYKVHSFTSSGTFTVTGTGNVEYLVVAGGGAGGGNNNGGGGGAGGFRTGTGHAVTAQGYTITVGAGGSGNSTAGQAPSGGDSTFSTITSTGGGGGGGGNSNEAGSNGGSGGGAAYTTSTSSGGSGNTPSTTPSQGNDGGDGSNGTAYGGGGGGGSGSVGVDATTIVGGNGGDGTSSSITGSALFYSGGGGGGSNAVSGGSSGSGGSSIGGNGAYATGSVAATNGTTNTGSGGGGCQSANTTGGNGGSGIVIIRYKTSSDITATGGTITTVTDAKPTDVQDNSILVEKATGKRYWFSEETAISYNINNADTQQETRSGSTTSNGVQILSGNSAIGHKLSSIMFPLKKSGSPPNTFRFEVYNSAGTLQAQTPTSSANSLTTSFVDTTLTLTTPHTIVAGDRIVVTYGSGDVSNKILVSEDNSVGSIPSNTTHTAYNSSWSESTSQWSNAKFTSTSATWTQEWNGSPNSVADLQGWWDASASDSTVSLLVDKSGNGYNLTQGTSARQPSVVSGAQNSLNALQFAPNTGSGYASEMMQNTSMPNAKSQTIFYVAKVTKTTSGDAGYNYYIWDTSSNDNYNGMTQRQDTWRIYAGNSVDVTETTWGVWRNLTMKYDGSNSILRDRGSQETVALTLEGSTDTGFTLNGYANGGDYGGTQDFGELIVYNRALTDTEIANVESYLTTKWGL